MSISEGEKPRPTPKISAWLVTLITPLVVILTALRVVVLPWIIPFEYNRLGFPPDPYGFTKEERIKWAGISLRYFSASHLKVNFIEDLRFEDGTSVYNDREIPHFQDAKAVFLGALQVWYWTIVLLFLLFLWALFGKWLQFFVQGLGRGGWLTLFLIASILFFAMIGFRTFFVAFHNIFFEPGTWVFFYSDTFIRLFPERFWFDMFLYIGLITVALSLLLILIGWRLGAKSVKTKSA